MVVLNTQSLPGLFDKLDFKYVIDLPRYSAIFISARDLNGKSQLFLIFTKYQHAGLVYQRNGLKGVWEERAEGSLYKRIIEQTQQRAIPRFTSDTFTFFG